MSLPLHNPASILVMVCMSVYLYGDKAKAAALRAEPTWQTWMGQRFPMPQMG